MDKVTAFDALFTNNHIQKLKVLLSYVDSPMQRRLAVYIKFLELKYTLELLRHSPQLSVSPPPREGAPDPAGLCQEVAPYCSPGEQRQLNHLTSMLQAMSHYQEMMETAQMLQELFPEGMPFPGGTDGGSGENGANMPDLSQLMSLMNMMQPADSPPADVSSTDSASE